MAPADNREDSTRQIFRTLRDIGFQGYLSVELFNRQYWTQSPLKVARASIEKTRSAMQKALAE